MNGIEGPRHGQMLARVVVQDFGFLGARSYRHPKTESECLTVLKAWRCRLWREGVYVLVRDERAEGGRRADDKSEQVELTRTRGVNGERWPGVEREI